MKKNTVYLQMFIKTNKVKYSLLVAVNGYMGSLFHSEKYIDNYTLGVFRKFYPSLTEEDFEDVYKKTFSKILKKYGTASLISAFEVPKTKTQNKKFLRMIKKAVREFFAELRRKENEKGLMEFLQKKGLEDRGCKIIYDLEKKGEKYERLPQLGL